MKIQAPPGPQPHGWEQQPMGDHSSNSSLPLYPPAGPTNLQALWVSPLGQELGGSRHEATTLTDPWLQNIRQLTFGPGCRALIKAGQSPNTQQGRPAKSGLPSLLNSAKRNSFWTFLLDELGGQSSEQHTVGLPSVYFLGKGPVA